MSELKPCPFCGGEAAIEEYNDGSGGVYCTVCRFEPLTHANYRCQAEKIKAIKEWNRRTPDIDIPADRMQEICEAEKDGRLVVLPEDGQIYYFEEIEETGEKWIGNKPVQYIDSEGYHCGWGFAVICFPFSELRKTVFLTKEEAEAALKDRP